MNGTDESTDSAPLDRAISVLSNLKVLAAEEDWEVMEPMVARLRIAITQVPLDQRAELLNDAAITLERMRTSVMSAKLNTADKLAEIRTGRVATRAYGRVPSARALR